MLNLNYLLCKSDALTQEALSLIVVHIELYCYHIQHSINVLLGVYPVAYELYHNELLNQVSSYH